MSSLSVSFRILYVLFITAIAVIQSSCAQLPSHSNIRDDRFGNETLSAKRIYILANLDAEYTHRVGQPLAEGLARQFQRRGFDTKVEVQLRNPLALGSDIDLRQAAKFSPHAVVVIRFGGVYSSNGQGTWTATFDLLNSQIRGIWRGSVRLRRLDKMPESSESIGEQMVTKLIDSGVLALRSPEI